MTRFQKQIAVIALGLIALTLVFAPFDCRINDVGHAIVYAPIWRGPNPKTIDLDLMTDGRMGVFGSVTEMTLDVGRLGLMWAGIVLAGIVVGLVTSSRDGIPSPFNKRSTVSIRRSNR